MTGVEISKGINVQKAIDIMLSLIVSPLVGLLVAGGLLLLLKKYFATSKIHKTPEERQTWDGKKTSAILDSFHADCFSDGGEFCAWF